MVNRIDDPANTTFQITDIKLHVPVVTLLTEDDKTFKAIKKRDVKELINGINIDQKRLNRLKLTIEII